MKIKLLITMPRCCNDVLLKLCLFHVPYGKNWELSWSFTEAKSVKETIKIRVIFDSFATKYLISLNVLIHSMPK